MSTARSRCRPPNRANATGAAIVNSQTIIGTAFIHTCFGNGAALPRPRTVIRVAPRAGEAAGRVLPVGGSGTRPMAAPARRGGRLAGKSAGGDAVTARGQAGSGSASVP
eukprot:scaffold574_cov92-Isochrysis_galbana.AAC.2